MVAAAGRQAIEGACRAGQVPAAVASLLGDVWREERMRLRLAVCLVLAGVAHAHAQQTVTVPPPAPVPSTFPQFQTYAGCLMNCDTRSATCQSTCSVSNSPTSTFAQTGTGTTAGTRPDPGALSQCFLSCNTQALTCKQTCTPPH